MLSSQYATTGVIARVNVLTRRTYFETSSKITTLQLKNAALRRLTAFAIVQGIQALGTAKYTVGEGAQLRLTREGIWGSVDSLRMNVDSQVKRSGWRSRSAIDRRTALRGHCYQLQVLHLNYSTPL